MAINVYFTNGTGQSLNRWDMLLWIHKNSDINHSKIEELCSGAAYCRLFNKLFPGSIPETKVKYRANQEYEYVCNFKLLQKAFEKLKVRQAIPVDRLVKGKFQDNYEFAQYFQKFYEANEGNLQGKMVSEGKEEACGTYRKEKIASKTSVSSGKLNTGDSKNVQRIVSPQVLKNSARKKSSTDLLESQVGDSFDKSKEPLVTLYSKEHLESSLKINAELLAQYEIVVKEKDFFANKILQAKSFLKDYPVTDENRAFLQKANEKLDIFISHYGLLPKEVSGGKHTHTPSPIETWGNGPQKPFDDVEMRDSSKDVEEDEQGDSTPRASKATMHNKNPGKGAQDPPTSAKDKRVNQSLLAGKKNVASKNTLKTARPVDTFVSSSNLKRVCRPAAKEEDSPVTLKASLGKFVGGISFRRQNYPDINSPAKGGDAANEQLAPKKTFSSSISSPKKKPPTICDPSNAGGKPDFSARSRVFPKKGEK